MAGSIRASPSITPPPIRNRSHRARSETLETIDWFFREGADLIHKYCHFYLMETAVEATRPQVEEGITECVWLPFDDALRTLTYDNARQVLEAAGRRLAALEGRG